MSENINIIVVKRDGKKVEFNGAKVALAIKKGFDSVKKENEDPIYTEKDSYKVYNLVIEEISQRKEDRIKIEEIQDLIEKILKQEGYDDVRESFSNYRERRNYSRQIFFDEKKQHKFLKAIEKLGLEKSSEDDGRTAMGSMLSYGQTLSKEFSKSYLIKRKYVDCHESREIYIHEIDYYPMGTTTCCHIDLEKLYTDGFSTGEGYFREPNSIMTYETLASISIQANQNDQHGGQSIPALDYYFAPGVIKTFKKEFRQTLHDFLDFTEFGIFAAVNGMEREIDKITTIDFDISIFDTYCRESEQLKRLFRITYDKAIKKTDKIVYQAMEAFVYNLNTMRSKAGAVLPNTTVSLGTDVSKEGRMITKNFLLAMEAGIGTNEPPKYPQTIFKVKDEINYDKKSPNYDLFELACKINSEKLMFSFSFLDSKFNKSDSDRKDEYSEVAYMGSSRRIFENIIDESKKTSIGRGNLSITTINLPKISIESKGDINRFYYKLDELLELVKEQLLDRYEYQADKRVYNFPFLIGQGVWMDSERLKPRDRLRRVNKYGTLSIGFMGLAECLVGLIGEHHGESEKAQRLGIEIIKHMKEKADEFSKLHNLNFNVYAANEEHLLRSCMEIDKTMYGKIQGITDKDKYTEGFMIPEDYNIAFDDKILIESKYHPLTLGGHRMIIDIGSKSIGNSKLQKDLIKKMKESEVGLAKFIIK